MLQDPIFPKGHHLSGYHYSGEKALSVRQNIFISSTCLSLIVQFLLKCFRIRECMFSTPAFVFLSGSDNWTPEEKCYFNKGISAYRKDFFMVQKLVCMFILSCSPSK